MSVAATVDTESPTVPPPGGRRGWRSSRTIGGLVVYEQVKVQSHLYGLGTDTNIYCNVFIGLELVLVPMHIARHHSNIYRIRIQIRKVI